MVRPVKALYRQAFNTSALHRRQLIPADFEMDRWRQDRERKWRHHHARRQQNRPGRETVWPVHIYILYNQTSTTCQGRVSQRCTVKWDFFFPAGKSRSRKESREPKSWTSCSLRPVPRQAAMSNRWSLLSPTFHHIWSTVLLVTVTQMWDYTTHINTTCQLQASQTLESICYFFLFILNEN